MDDDQPQNEPPVEEQPLTTPDEPQSEERKTPEQTDDDQENKEIMKEHEPPIEAQTKDDVNLNEVFLPNPSTTETFNEEIVVEHPTDHPHEKLSIHYDDEHEPPIAKDDEQSADLDTLKESKLSTGFSELTRTESPLRGAKSFVTTSLAEDLSTAKFARRRTRDKGRTDKMRQALGSIIEFHGPSLYYGEARVGRFMNSYKLESDNPFNPEKVEKILENVLLEAMENLTYDKDMCPKQAKWASSTIRKKIKELEFDRYKLVCIVTIGEKNSQDVLATCRFLWDIEKDRYAFYAAENTYIFGIAQCFGLYYE